MADNLTRQILREHLVGGDLRLGSPIGLHVDETLLQDATGTMAFMQFEQLGIPRVCRARSGTSTTTSSSRTTRTPTTTASCRRCAGATARPSAAPATAISH
jgi:homoaconitase/3-isopropylmalate dehydratase large subunit